MISLKFNAEIRAVKKGGRNTHTPPTVVQLLQSSPLEKLMS